MFYNNISYLVGSANAKLANDMKKFNKQKDSSRIERVTNKLNSYLCRQTNNDSSNSSTASTLDLDLDFELVKISCKKEMTCDENRPTSCLKKLLDFIKFKWLFRIVIFILIGSLICYTIFRIVQFTSRKFKTQEAVVLNSKRDTYFHDFMSEWSGEAIPSVYELDPITFFDSNGDGYGDLRGIMQKLDYIKTKLKINCILIRNLQMNLPEIFGHFFELDNVDQKIGNFLDLKNLIFKAHEKDIKIILELDLTGTYFGHKWMFLKDFDNIYLTKNKTELNRDLNDTWQFNKEKNKYFYSGEYENFAYFNMDNQTTHEKLFGLIEYWSTSIKADGIYFKNFDKIQYKNGPLFERFISNTRNICHSMYMALIGDYVDGDNLKNSLYDIHRINLNSIDIYNNLKQNSSKNLFETYLNENRKYLWYLDNLDNLPYHAGSRRNLFIGFYSIIYSLPGMVLLRQGDELEYEKKTTSHLKIYRWNDLENHSGFSLNFTDNLIWLRKNPSRKISNVTESYASSTISQSILYEPGFDSISVQKDTNSLWRFLVLLNTRVKPKLVDIRIPSLFTTTMFPFIPKAPEPFRNSFLSISDSYLSRNYYELKMSNSLLKVTRQINNYKSRRKDYTSYAIRFFRNVIFLFNFSEFNILLDQLIKVSPDTDDQSQLIHSTLHVIYDSTKSMPEYIKLDAPMNQAFYYVKPNSYLILEF